MLSNNKSHHHCHNKCSEISHNHSCHTQKSLQLIPSTHTDCCDHFSPSQTELSDPPDDPDPSLAYQRLSWTIKGMDCAHCAQKVENALKPLSAIVKIKIHFMTEKLVVLVKKDHTNISQAIENKIQQLGYRPISLDVNQTATHQKSHYINAFLPLIGYASLIIASYLTLFINANFGQWAFIITAIIGIVPITKKAITLLFSGTPFAIESLLTFSAVGAIFIGAAEEATMVIFLFMIGEMLEGFAAYKAKKGISSLINLMPNESIIINNGTRQKVPSTTLQPDDMIEISAGGRLPADIVLISSIANIDESALTGESLPVIYHAGDKILAGSIVVNSTILAKVVSEQGQNAVDRILTLIEEADESKAPIERFIDKFSFYYTPAITLFALLIMILPPLLMNADWYTWIYRGLTLLLIGCPCALVISTPAVITSALSCAAKQGVLIKGGAALELIGQIKNIAFDKTGTLTQGKPEITDIQSNAMQDEQLITLAASIEEGSHHPIANAILDYANLHKISYQAANNRQALAGIGVQGDIDNKTYYLVSPNQDLIDMQQLATRYLAKIEALESEGKTVILITTKEQCIGLLALRDKLRPEAKDAILQLSQLSIHSIMLTGDNHRSAKAIASDLNIDYLSQLRPEDKVNQVKHFVKQSPTAMVGDGINDSPAMKAATVGIAMGTASEVALETADAALAQNNLLSLAKLIRLSRFANLNIKQNVSIALGIKLIFLVTSLLGITGLWIAVLADSGATAIVTANALRVLRFKK